MPSKHKLALLPGHIANFETLKRACLNGDLGLVGCADAVTGEYRAVICAMVTDEDGNTTMTPFGHLCPDNPYDAYVAPDTEEAK